MSGDDVLNKNDNNTLKGISEEGNSNEKTREQRINTIISDLNDLINDIRNSRQISDAVVQSQSLNLNQGPTASQTITDSETPTQSQSTPIGQGSTQSQAPSATANVTTTITQTAQTLVALNSIKTELCRLPLDFCEREYIANCVIPLETAMEFISRTGFELATSVSILTTSPIVPRKKGKLKDTIHTIYSINEEVEDIYKVLRKRLKKLTQEDNCCTFP
ncbi:hypothetical protein G9F72_006070 [Clostridium estertheticum]|uniref:hypothetical protein n=1 Tax=Clostridium estertheticum TaxID=238834 RepID=UPI0013E9138F|nr:hypothetical protein [Clostridium estertheticum]MBZ9685908.1 hypothetical protein [Clostridium estertheticum]